MEREIILKNKLGLHLRAAAALTKVTNKYPFEIYILKEDQEVNAKSIMSVVSLAAPCGTRLIIKAEGKNAAEALDEIIQLVEKRFGEKE